MRKPCCGDPRQIPDSVNPFRRQVPASGAAARCPGGFTYRVQPGQTLYSLAREFGVPWGAVFVANPGMGSPNSLRVGTLICVPTDHIPRCPGGQLYELQSDETPASVADRLGLALEELLDLNPQVSDPGRTFPGQRLCIPREQEEE